jgi:hypothetical protein
VETRLKLRTERCAKGPVLAKAVELPGLPTDECALLAHSND